MKKILYGLLITSAILGTMYACIDLVWSDMCANDIDKEIRSPKGDYKAVIFIRHCGATTGFSRQLSIVEISDDLENEKGNVFILGDKAGNQAEKINVIWTTDNSLTIFFAKETEFFLQNEEIGEVKIRYEQLAE